MATKEGNPRHSEKNIQYELRHATDNQVEAAVNEFLALPPEQRIKAVLSEGGIVSLQTAFTIADIDLSTTPKEELEELQSLFDPTILDVKEIDGRMFYRLTNKKLQKEYRRGVNAVGLRARTIQVIIQDMMDGE